MLTKKMLTLFFAVSFTCCLSSFTPNTAAPLQKEHSLTVVGLYKQFIVSGTTYNVYWHYDTGTGAVSNFRVYLIDCTECLVTDVSGSSTYTPHGTFNWQASGTITVTTTCGIFQIQDEVYTQEPYC